MSSTSANSSSVSGSRSTDTANGMDLPSERNRNYWQSWLTAWDQFWFQATRPESLAVIRICCGAMLVYMHVIWISLIPNFFGPNAWINLPTIRMLHESDSGWSWLHYVDNPAILYAHEAIAIIASTAMCFGLMTRIAIPVAWWFTLMVCHRMTGALFGLDQTAMMLTTYLIWSNCGSMWSLDSRLAIRKGTSWLLPASNPAVCNNVVTRLIQLHLCVIYLFGGLSKMRGEMWWDGSAFWFSIVNYEYQSLNLTWLGNFPFVIGFITAVTIFWETFYIATVWPKLTRPITLAMAVLVHGGICVALGMWTFGTIMIVANIAFLPPETVSAWIRRIFPSSN